MYLNTGKAIDFVNRLEMIKGNNDIFNNFELKFLRAREEDNLATKKKLQEYVEEFDDNYLKEDGQYGFDPMNAPKM